MKKLRAALPAISLAVSLSGCALGSGSERWTSMIDGTRGLDNFNRVGEANWSATDGAIQASEGGKTPAYLVSKAVYGDFALRAEIWVSEDANSGVFFRCQDPAQITDENCYEANIFDQRPDPAYATGAIVKVARLTAPMLKAGGKWNTLEVTARGTRLTVVLNGTKTAEVDDSKLANGPIALQWGRGLVRFRKVEIRSL